ncbi:50S ribosomal protein L15 [Metamycoplasma salivarium]|uniref:Large ribosomal subunit protein uL15 n=2 Tax=Metamycoplasma salivarium TaxID=2124 RepID=A0A448ZXU2_METSV|nr:50S ribosomal protein L15 [Metamycoplasma salivarium]CAD7360882.1 50S ribosomal protein L15 [Metamycoplasma salivarium]VEU56078.1 50S ribosomal protein L15 [Metamycoplasma salivarium]GIZ05720.1 50S ribosomal protein L15 [Metamycoplasma salivarium]GIZ06281.1 50S ribosomal protein L15 [Metamycoplasma salivarium]GIZ06915.1 50S ribosomal protein L15 [Metamycoplasma salivarium]
MELHTLKPTAGSRKDKHRVGRGHAAGKGKQAGRGQSGQTKRSTVRLGFEGGQNPLFRRIPKRGFNNVNHVEYQIVNLDDLEKTFKANSVVSYETLFEHGLVKRSMPVKILGRGQLTKKLTVKIPALSETARLAIEKAGGKIEVE